MIGGLVKKPIELREHLVKFQLPTRISNSTGARGNISRYGNKVENRDNRRSQASLREEGSTTIERIAIEKNYSE